MEFIVTTTREHQEQLKTTAERWARALQVPLVARSGMNLDVMLEEYEADAILVAANGGPKVYSKAGTFFYHPSMAKLRIQNLQDGKEDHLINAMDLKPGMRVLDCTLGLAADAAVCSYVVGEQGKVTGLEASELLHFAVQYGLKNYDKGTPELLAALQRIVAVRANAKSYLASRTEEYDVIYFDPMFETPVEESSAMKPLRHLACQDKLTKDVIDLALQRAPRVVIKERYMKILRELGCTEFFGGKYSSVKFGVVHK